MSKLTLDNTVKRFKDGSSEITAVDNVSMEIDDGEFVVIVGPSGCGKSTTLRMIAGLETVTDGDIYIGDRKVTGLRAQNRDIAMVFQSYALYPHLTVRENMSFGLEQSTDLPNDEIHEKVSEIGELLDISELLDRKPGDLSGGQQQRVALGRAIVRDPDVFLMDEPLSNLDAKLRATMRTELQRLHDELETTTIYVTHDQTEAMTMGDRIAILDHGELQQLGTPLECYYEPNNEFVAGFIGEPSMNFLRATRNESVLEFDGFTYELSDQTTSELGSTTDLQIGIRPEDIIVFPERESPNDIDVRVDVVEPFGKENNLYLFPSNGDRDTSIISIVQSKTQVREGSDIAMRLPEEKLYFFDGRSGEAIKHPDIEKEELNSTMALA